MITLVIIFILRKLTVSEIVVENSSLVIVTIAQGLVDAIAIVFEEVVCSWRLIVLVWF